MVLGLAVAAHADRKALEPYAGRIVYSPDTPPTSLGELPGFLKINATKDDRYDIIHGPPWPMHLVAVLAKAPGTRPVQLVFSAKDDATPATLVTVDVKPRRRIVIATTTATVAAGFASNATYVVRVMQGKTILARAEITLRN